MMNDLSLVKQFVSTLPPGKWRRHAVIVAVSGGADSTALLRLSANLLPKLDSGPITVVHANHKLRGSESDADESFVEKLANDLGLAFQAAELPPSGIETAKGLEGELRSLRYDWFTRVANETGARYVLTGHTLGDQVETVLFRIIRGTGLAGLAGIPRVRETGHNVSVVRPLLSIHRNELENWLKQIGQPWRSDSTNERNDFTRNRIRNALLPTLRSSFNAQVDQGLVRLARQAAEHTELLNDMTNPLIGLHVQFRPDEEKAELDARAFATAKPVVMRHALVRIWQTMSWPERDMTFEKWQQLADFIRTCVSPDSPGTRTGTTTFPTMLPGHIRVEVIQSHIIIARQRRGLASDRS